MTMKFISTFDDYENKFAPYNVNVTKDGIATTANEFLRELGEDYELNDGKQFDPKRGNCAWFVDEFYTWSENNRIPGKVIYFSETDKAKDAHVAILIGDLVLDFTHKQFSKNPKEKFSILPIGDYKKYGYDVENYQVYDGLPNWVSDIHPLKEKD
jgi:hypothetical protein